MSILERLALGESVVLTAKDVKKKQLPSRANFHDLEKKDYIDDLIANNKPIPFLPNDIYEESYVDNKQVYYVNLYGITPDGCKTVVVIKDIPIYVDVAITSKAGETPAKTLDDLRRYVREINNNVDLPYKVVQLYPFKGFSENKKDYLRLYFNTLAARKTFITKAQVETANDDTGGPNNYFNKFARESAILTADWNLISNYEVISKKKIRCFHISYLSIVALDTELFANTIIEKDLLFDRTLTATWDIETYKAVEDGLAPRPGDDYTIFMINSAYFWHYSDEPLFDICIVMGKVAPRKGVSLIIQCESEKEVLAFHIKILSRMTPDFLVAYNGSGFDWPITLDKLAKYKMITKLFNNVSFSKVRDDDEEQVKRWKFSSIDYKIDATSNHLCERVANFPGMIDIDAMPVVMKKHPTSEFIKAVSLNHFLKMNKLEEKHDLSYKDMFKYFERSQKKGDCYCLQRSISKCKNCYTNDKCCICDREKNLEEMAEVAYYCTIDCISVQRLLNAEKIISDKREFACLSSTCLKDAIFRADGMRIRNLVGKFCAQEYAFSNKPTNKSDGEKVYYQGAKVFPPMVGINKKRPITGLDFSSLYPSLMMAYNLSPDMLVTDPAEAERLIATGYNLHKIEPFKYLKGEKKNKAIEQHSNGGWTVRHNNVENQQQIITNYDVIINGKKTTALEEFDNLQCIKFEPVYGRDALPGERMGVFPSVVKKLFDLRLPLKEEVVRLGKLIEKMTKDKLETIVYNLKSYTLSEIDSIYTKVKAKQNALKVLANTAYGESGNFRSSIFDVNIASAVTASGRYNITNTAQFVKSLGLILHYGDTDSLYLQCPDVIYEQIDNDYELSDKNIEQKEHYWTQMVKITMDYMTKIKLTVAEFLCLDNNTLFLKMAYEEVGFPTVFCGKKKYYMIAHEETINFYPKKLMIRGIDIIKRGQANITKKIGNDVMFDSIAITDNRTMMEIVVQKMAEIAETKWDVDMFSMTSKYKPSKASTATKFADRLRLADNAPPEPGDSFQYVMTKKDQLFDERGCKVKMGKHDYMEYSKLATLEDINLDWYFENQIAGVLARFIASDAQFKPDAECDLDDDDACKLYDKECVSRAKNYLIQRWNTMYKKNIVDPTLGLTYKRQFRLASMKLSEKLKGCTNGTNATSGITGKNNIIIGKFQSSAELILKELSTPSKAFITLDFPMGKFNITRMKKNYDYINNIRRKYIAGKKAEIIKQAEIVMLDLEQVSAQYKKYLTETINKMRNSEEVNFDDYEINSESLDIFNMLSYEYIKLDWMDQYIDNIDEQLRKKLASYNKIDTNIDITDMVAIEY